MKLYVVIGSTETDLDDIAVLQGHDGWGMAPQHRLAQRGAQQHGDTDLGFRLDPRIGSLLFRLPSRTMQDMHTRRDQLVRLFSPENAPVLKWVLDSGAARCIAVVYSGDMSLAWDTADWTAQQVTVRLKASDPTFYDPEVASVSFALGGGADAFEVPTPVPTPMGASTLDATASIVYTGTWHAQPHLVRVTGPITDGVITNVLTGEKLDFTGVTIAAGHYYDVDCRYGHKSVLDDGGTNRIADLTDDSDLATFHIAAPVWPATSRINPFRVTGSGVTAATNIQVSYYRRFTGI